MGKYLLTALALMLIIEGLLPFLVPGLWRETFRRLTELSDGQMRFVGLTSHVVRGFAAGVRGALGCGAQASRRWKRALRVYPASCL